MPEQISSDNLQHAGAADVFADRQRELEASADKMPKPLTSKFPYLMEKATGHIHPYTKSMAARSDLVVGCYNLDGSRDPSDADPNYDPTGGMRSYQKRNENLQQLPPQTPADYRAALAEERKKIRRELEAEFALKYGNAASSRFENMNPVEDVVDTPVEDVADTPVEDVVDTPVEDVVDTPVEDVVDAPVEDVVDTPVEDVVDAPVEDVVDAPVEDVVDAPVEDVVSVDDLDAEFEKAMQ